MGPQPDGRAIERFRVIWLSVLTAILAGIILLKTLVPDVGSIVSREWFPIFSFLFGSMTLVKIIGERRIAGKLPSARVVNWFPDLLIFTLTLGFVEPFYVLFQLIWSKWKGGASAPTILIICSAFVAIISAVSNLYPRPGLGSGLISVLADWILISLALSYVFVIGRFSFFSGKKERSS